jgi:cytochrome c oxidase subunit IV
MDHQCVKRIAVKTKVKLSLILFTLAAVAGLIVSVLSWRTGDIVAAGFSLFVVALTIILAVITSRSQDQS